jgi:hypothetical protein
MAHMNCLEAFRMGIFACTAYTVAMKLLKPFHCAILFAARRSQADVQAFKTSGVSLHYALIAAKVLY